MGIRDTIRAGLTAAMTPPAAPSAHVDSAPEPRRDVTVGDTAREALREVGRRVDSLFNTLTGIGGEYDKGVTAEPDTSRIPMTDDKLDILYRFNGYIERYVDRHAEEATRASWTVEDGSDDTDPMDEEDERLNVVSRFEEAVKWARLYGGCVILIVVDEGGNEDLSEPININRVRAVTNLVVLDKREATAAEYDGDITSKNYRNVKYWSLSPVRSFASLDGARGMNRVHHSRVVYIPGKKLPPTLRMRNQGYDESVVQAVWDKARNLEVVDQAGAILSMDLKHDVLKVEGLSEIAAGDQAEYFETRMKLIAKQRSLLGMIILGDGETYDTRSANITGYANLHDRAKEAFAAVCDTPQTVMFGTPPSGLNTDGDSSRKNFDKSIARFQAKTLYDPLQKIYALIYAAKKGPFKGRIPKKIKIKFSSLENLSAKERAELEKVHAETDAIRVEWGFVTVEHVTRSRHSESGYSNELLPVSEEDIEAMSNAAAAKEVEEQLRAELEAAKAALNGAGNDDPNQGGNNGEPPPE